MVFVTAIRDYIDWINASFDALGQEMNVVQFLQQTFFYLLSSVKVGLLYVITFQWLRDLAYLPVLIPQYTEAVVKEHLYFAENPILNVFSFAETPTLLQNKFVIGFLNSIFTALPFSCAQLIALRRFYVQGWPAAAVTSLGVIAGHSMLLFFVLFGCRAVIIPWLQFEPWNYIIGLTIILSIVYDMGQAGGVVQYREFSAKHQKAFLAMGAGAFALTLCEQSLIFQHISNLTFGLEPNFLEPATSTSFNLTAQHSLYLFGFMLGSVVFTYLSYWAAVGVRLAITRIFRITQVRFHAYYHRYSKLFIMTLALSSIPCYGVDYFVTNPLGFVPYDTALVPGVFAPNTMHDLFLQRWEGDVKFPREVVTDQALAGFDRGIFMRYMPGKMNPENRRARDESVFGAHEDYTIPVEYAWTSEHNQRLRTRWDFIERHKKNLKRFYGWLEQTGTGDRLAKMMGTETAQERQDRRQREQAETRDAEQAQLAEQEKRHHLWSPEHFDQFTIVDNYTWKDEPFTHHANKSEINAAYRLAHNLLDTSDFAKIENTQRLLNDLRNEAERSQRDTVEQFDLSAPITTKVSKFLVQQNFQEKVHYEQLEKVNDNEETRKMTLPWIWPGLNSYFPENLQEKMRPKHVNFPGRKQRQVQNLFLNNPLYKVLMRTDIDAFLARQPKTHLLTSDEEAELYYKRTMLSDYYNSLRKYRRMNNSDEFRLAYGGVKSFSHKVFNHQFKGTYRIARRLFAIDLSPDAHPNFPESRERVFKYDMPLFDDTQSHNPMIHEELQKARELKQATRVNSKPSKRARRPKPFFKPTNTSPFYCGWDETKRQFVLTNRLLPRSLAGARMTIPSEFKEYKGLAALAKQEFEKQPKTNNKAKRQRNENEIAFTWWPVPASVANDHLRWDSRRGVYASDRGERHKLDPNADNLDVDLVTRFNPNYEHLPKVESAGLMQETVAIMEEDFEPWKGEQWPTGFGVREPHTNLSWLFTTKPPTPFADRGGFVWPGHETLKIDLDALIPDRIRPIIKQAHDFYQAYLT
jgi:hypothetical protein